jgi:hypothetical protein
MTTQTSDLVLFSEAIAGGIVPVFRSKLFVRNFITIADLPGGTKNETFAKRGDHTANTVAEAGTAPVSDRSDASVTLTVQKSVVRYQPTIESIDFSREDEMRVHRDEAASALYDKFEKDVLSLSTGASQSVGTTDTDLTVGVFRQAAFLAGLNEAPAPLVSMIHNVQLNDLGSDVANTDKVYYSGGNDSSVVNAQSNIAKPTPSLLGIPIYASNHNATINSGADYSGIVCSKYALCAIWNEQFGVMIEPKAGTLIYDISVYGYNQAGELDDSSMCEIVSDA